MAEAKTKATDASVEDFLNAVEDEQKRADCFAIAKLMQQATKAKPKMWGSSIVGFGETQITYANGRKEDWMMIGFSPRKANIVLYGLAGGEQYDALLAKLGKHKTGKGCLYINKMTDVDKGVLKGIIQQAVERK